MRDVEGALLGFELAHRELVAANPSDFESLVRLSGNRGIAMDAVLGMIEEPGLTDDQLSRLKRVHLGGMLSLERIRSARRVVREELSRLTQQGQLLAGYRVGSTTEPIAEPTPGPIRQP